MLGVLIPLALAATAAPPPFELVRANERWHDVDGAPPYKDIALTPDGDAYVSLGGETRVRVDAFDAPRYGIGRVADTYALTRALVHADWHFGERVRVFAQLGREDAIGKKPPLAVSDVDRGDVRNLFVDVAFGQARDVTLRAGRQELMFNATQRFVSVREGPNVRQSFDGARATWQAGAWRIDAFALRPVAVDPDPFDDAADGAQAFRGAYASRRIGAHATLDVYALSLDRDDATFGSVRGDERRDSVGARYAGAARGFDVDVEALAQHGRFAGRAIRAWAAGAIVGYTARAAWSPRVALEVDAGSGDRAGTRALETFNPLFPKGAYFDESALMSWSNALVARASVGVAPRDGVALRASVLSRRRMRADDAVYVQPYAPLAPTLADRSRDVGRAVVLDASWRVDRAWTLTAQVARHDAGAAIERAGGRDADFAMFVAQWKF
ncbi:alginate export family protein [Tahibacter soli]|uniref:Alginate export family protein n=1 Tax=Tahibacter soli TaxID=2983605 RepID=A0A9X3YG25_9GAMM|nr:alginate export family protein [Tahibacter soli]MDC8011454.1 alginate export family protein [Tahibacter soli]